MPLCRLQAQPMFWRYFLSSIARAGPYLALPNMQSPGVLWVFGCWRVSICASVQSKNTNYCHRYVLNILKKTPRSVDQVTIQPDGKWELHNKKENVNTSRANGFASDDDDDLVEVTKNGDSVTMGTPQAWGVSSGSLAQRSVSASSGPSNQAPSSNKRPIAAVIDLTSSGDEDDEPISRTPKRQQMNGYSGSTTAPVFRPQANGYNPRHWCLALHCIVQPNVYDIFSMIPKTFGLH
jgi:hypothetical protein